MRGAGQMRPVPGGSSDDSLDCASHRTRDESVGLLDGFNAYFESSESSEVAELDGIELSELPCQMRFV